MLPARHAERPRAGLCFCPDPKPGSRAQSGEAIGTEMSERCQKLEGATGPRARSPLRNWSGRPDSNRRRPAWEAGILPLNYGRPAPPIVRIGERRRYCDSLSDMLKAWMTSSLRAFQLTRLLTP